MKLYLFGHSACLPYHLPNQDSFWGTKLAAKLRCDTVKNYSQSGADNLYIYNSVISHVHLIDKHDLAVVGWSHPSRKTFVLDPSVSDELLRLSMVYPGNPTFFRSNNAKTHDNREKWSRMRPSDTGVSYFDDWFNRYYNRYEAEINFRAYVDSVKSVMPCSYIFFYFSKESVGNLGFNGFYWLDWILQERCWISQSDLHPNDLGHHQLSEIFYSLFTT